MIDYGVGNLFSVKRALEYCGEEKVIISDDPETCENATHLILPGVGAFPSGMNGLKNKKLTETLYSYIESGRPFLGICLGMQMLVTESDEFEFTKGLNIIPGVARVIKREKPDGSRRRVPYIGWAKLNLKNNNKTELFYNIKNEEYAYFVHSWAVETQDPINEIAHYNYEELKITAATQKKNVIGLQFHPEKSGEIGLKILKNYLNMRENTYEL